MCRFDTVDGESQLSGVVLVLGRAFDIKCVVWVVYRDLPLTRPNQLVQLLIEESQGIGRTGRNAVEHAGPSECQAFHLWVWYNSEYLLPHANRPLVHRLEKEIVSHTHDFLRQGLKLLLFGQADLLIVQHLPVPRGQQGQQAGIQLNWIHSASPSLSRAPAGFRPSPSRGDLPYRR